MATTPWQSFQAPPFQVPWTRPQPSLHIREFTSNTYETLKQHERDKQADPRLQQRREDKRKEAQRRESRDARVKRLVDVLAVAAATVNTWKEAEDIRIATPEPDLDGSQPGHTSATVAKHGNAIPHYLEIMPILSEGNSLRQSEIDPDKPHATCVASPLDGITEKSSAVAGQSPVVSVERTSSTSWDSAADDSLLHLRGIAQLKWQSIRAYFPGKSVACLKARYNLIQERRANQQQKWTPISRIHAVRKSEEESSRDEFIGRHMAARAIPTTLGLKRGKGRTVRKAPTRSTVSTCVRSLSATPARDSHPISRVLRCGRTIVHPKRHRPLDGYI